MAHELNLFGSGAFSGRHEVCECGHCRCGHRSGFAGCLVCACGRYTWPGEGADITTAHDPASTHPVPR